MTLVDTNVLLDIVTNDPHWYGWSAQQLEIAASRGPLYINQIVYAETSVRFSTVEAMDGSLERMGCKMIDMPTAALFLAGKIFQRYRAAGGTREGVLSDFFIGAHAAIMTMPLLSRDARPFRTYFPMLQLITPQLN